eukprot:NODE_2481_length_1192_cov_17.240595_g2264_i0.p1 GENE.NODE_2481_length_1192_cov_17.240595_g2264_i0~~NODE_2481_length_1192_cov_17.240595_g2264_i0.p1  ORF type:complete len:231 (-),score=27.92 NODE_2481_length_1192_cov_17.240595_g2264_i0:387-1079(-)
MLPLLMQQQHSPLLTLNVFLDSVPSGCFRPTSFVHSPPTGSFPVVPAVLPTSKRFAGAHFYPLKMGGGRQQNDGTGIPKLTISSTPAATGPNSESKHFVQRNSPVASRQHSKSTSEGVKGNAADHDPTDLAANQQRRPTRIPRNCDDQGEPRTGHYSIHAESHAKQHAFSPPFPYHHHHFQLHQVQHAPLPLDVDASAFQDNESLAMVLDWWRLGLLTRKECELLVAVFM